MEGSPSKWIVIILFILVLIVNLPRIKISSDIELLRQETVGDLEGARSYRRAEYARTNPTDRYTAFQGYTLNFAARFDIPPEYYDGKTEILFAKYTPVEGEPIDVMGELNIGFEDETAFQDDVAAEKLNRALFVSTPVRLYGDFVYQDEMGNFEVDVLAKICRSDDDCIPVGGKFLFEQFETKTIYAPIATWLAAMMSV